MFLRIAIFVALFLQLSNLVAQEVTFSGSVSRHELSNPSVEVKGEVHIRFGRFESSVIVVPFVMSANQTSSNYTKSLMWSLAGSDGSEDHDFFVVQLYCTQNCEEAKLTEKMSVYNPEGQTSTYQFRTEQFGEGSRRGGYIVNLKMLPNYGIVSATFVLPDGKVATKDLNMSVTVYDVIGDKFGPAARIFSKPLTIKRNSRSADFSLSISERFISPASVPGFLTIGYSCESPSCAEHDLLSSGWLRKDFNTVTANDAEVVSESSLILSMYESDSFSFKFPSAIELLQALPVQVSVARSHLLVEQAGVIKGRIIVEKLDAPLVCSEGGELWFDTSLIDCYNDIVVTDFTNKIVSETPFLILAARQSTSVTVGFEPMNQRNVLQETQTVRFVCDSGCEQRPYIESGFFSGFTRRFPVLNFYSSYKFKQTSDFFNKTLNINLRGYSSLAPVYSLLLDETTNY